MEMYNFYKNKYNLSTLDIKITDEKILFLIYDSKYNYYFDCDKFITENEDIDILKKINYLNKNYKLSITNFYPVCFCRDTLVIALKTDDSNTTLTKKSDDKILLKYDSLIKYHKTQFYNLFVSANIKKEIFMSQKYIKRYVFHEKFLKKYIFTEKRRLKKEFRDILYNLLPSKKSIIDISCGDNSDIFLIAKKKGYETIVGNDICINYLNLYRQNSVIYTNDDIELNRIKENSYDVSFCKNTLHHMNNITNINNALNLLNKISNTIIIVEIMNPAEYRGIPKFLNKYLYTKFLKDVGNCYLNEEQFKNVISSNFEKHKIEYKTFKNILGTYQIAKITKMEVD